MSDKPEASGCWIPMPLANLLFDCYYGGGPRHQDRQARQLEPPPQPASPYSDPGRLQMVNSITRAKPRGFAARQQMAADKMEEPPITPAPPE